jgi:hypothetical protein
MRDFDEQSDRVVAILAGSYLEELLKDLLIVKVKLNPDLIDSLLFRNLGSFRYKIQTSRKIGLITADEQHDLDMIRKIRNVFAHRFVALSFDTHDVSQQCYALRLSEIGEKPEKARQCFQKTTVRLMVNLHGTLIDLEKNQNLETR